MKGENKERERERERERKRERKREEERERVKEKLCKWPHPFLSKPLFLFLLSPPRLFLSQRHPISTSHLFHVVSNYWKV
jgi:hypothetical protein